MRQRKPTRAAEKPRPRRVYQAGRRARFRRVQLARPLIGRSILVAALPAAAPARVMPRAILEVRSNPSVRPLALSLLPRPWWKSQTLLRKVLPMPARQVVRWAALQRKAGAAEAGPIEDLLRAASIAATAPSVPTRHRLRNDPI